MEQSKNTLVQFVKGLALLIMCCVLIAAFCYVFFHSGRLIGLLGILAPFVWIGYFTHFLMKTIQRNKVKVDYEYSNKIGGAIMGILLGIAYIIIFIFL